MNQEREAYLDLLAQLDLLDQLDPLAQQEWLVQEEKQALLAVQVNQVKEDH